MKMKETALGYYDTGLSVFAVAAGSPGLTARRGDAGEAYGINLQISPVAGEVEHVAEAANEAIADQEQGVREIAVAVFRGHKGLADADVAIHCEPLTGGAPVEVPIRRLRPEDEPADELAQATRFGSTVVMQPGPYHIEVVIDGKASAAFVVDV